MINNDLPQFKNLLQHSLNRVADSVVHIRGLNVTLEDLSSIDGEVETLMWNPLHFAVYYNRLNFVKHIIAMRVNFGLSLRKAPAESEMDPTNTVSFAEDKIMVLLIAV